MSAQQPPAVLTIDTDWAPDPAIDFTAQLLLDHGTRATWFVTHVSPAITRLRAHPELFELGVHPNFLPGSTHGDTPERVLDHVMGLVPEATSMRSHALVQSTPLLELVLTTTPIRCDVSLLLPGARHLEVLDYQWKGARLLRIPYFWEDDVEMVRHRPCWDPAVLATYCEGLRVFAFHPIHVMLNSSSLEPYAALKASVSTLQAASPEQIAPFIERGDGTRTLLCGLLDAIDHESCRRVRDICDDWRAG